MNSDAEVSKARYQEAPKARNIPAQANGLGTGQNKPPRAEGPAYSSVPDIPLIEFNPVPGEKCPVFLLKTASAMVLFLRVNVGQERVEIGWSHGECAVSLLPRELR